MVVKKLTRQGNSAALIIDKPILDLLDINQDTELKVTVNGRQLIIEPLSEREMNARVDEAIVRTGRKYADGFRRLAK